VDSKDFRYNEDDSILLVEQKIEEKRNIIKKLESYPGIIHYHMVEIHTDVLNAQLITICKTNIEDILKNMNNSIIEKVRKLLYVLNTDKNT